MPLELAIAQLAPRKGAYADNLRRLLALVAEAVRGERPADLVLAPESAPTGYFLEGGVREHAVTADRLYADLAAGHADQALPPVDLALGFYEVHRNRIYNSALYATLGGAEPGIRHVHRKIFLPTYGVFDEERFVEAGRAVQAFDTPWGRAALLVCEDAWHAFLPMLAALDGAQLLLVPSASPARGPGGAAAGEEIRPASMARWERIMQTMAAEHGLYVALAQLAGFEGGKALAGGSLVADPRGEVLARAPIFEESLLRVTLDLEEITRARVESPLLADLEMRLPHLLGSLHAARRGRDGGRAGGTAGRRDEAPAGGAGLRVSAEPTFPPSRRAAVPPPLEIHPPLTRRWLVAFLQDEVIRRRGFERVVVGLSGGLDSALVAWLAAEAFGPGGVLGVRLPHRQSSAESLAHAELVAERLGIELVTVDITAAVDGLASALEPAPDPRRLGNIMARVRMTALFDLSAAHDALPLGTGNKSERLLGYFTWHGDDAPPVNPIGDLYKTQVRALARHLGLPAEIVDKPPTADLVAGQTDEGDFGVTYERADPILHWLVSGYDPDAVAARGFSPEEIDLVRRRLDGTHWKRRPPTVAMLSDTAVGEGYLRPVDY